MWRSGLVTGGSGCQTPGLYSLCMKQIQCVKKPREEGKWMRRSKAENRRESSLWGWVLSQCHQHQHHHKRWEQIAKETSSRQRRCLGLATGVGGNFTVLECTCLGLLFPFKGSQDKLPLTVWWTTRILYYCSYVDHIHPSLHIISKPAVTKNWASSLQLRLRFCIS